MLNCATGDMPMNDEQEPELKSFRIFLVKILMYYEELPPKYCAVSCHVLKEEITAYFLEAII